MRGQNKSAKTFKQERREEKGKDKLLEDLNDLPPFIEDKSKNAQARQEIVLLTVNTIYKNHFIDAYTRQQDHLTSLDSYLYPAAEKIYNTSSVHSDAKLKQEADRIILVLNEYFKQKGNYFEDTPKAERSYRALELKLALEDSNGLEIKFK